MKGQMLVKRRQSANCAENQLQSKAARRPISFTIHHTEYEDYEKLQESAEHGAPAVDRVKSQTHTQQTLAKSLSKKVPYDRKSDRIKDKKSFGSYVKKPQEFRGESLHIAIEKEIQSYLMMPEMDSDVNPLDWWKTQEINFPTSKKVPVHPCH